MHVLLKSRGVHHIIASSDKLKPERRLLPHTNSRIMLSGVDCYHGPTATL